MWDRWTGIRKLACIPEGVADILCVAGDAGAVPRRSAMTTFALLSVIVSLAALFGLLSYRVLRLPTSIGTTILTLVSAGAILGIGRAAPGLREGAAHLVSGIDFNAVVLHGMLAFLLFAGALSLNLDELRRQKLVVASLSLVATGVSTVGVGVLLRWVLLAVGVKLSLMGALLFGALISPTDPIAVLEMLRRVGAPKTLEAQLAGESLFNDGIGAVIFVALMEASTTGALPTPSRFLGLLALKSVGAVALGAGLGWLTQRMLLLVDEYRVEVLLTLALAMGGYALADALKLSGPLEAVTAGLLMGGPIREQAMSARTREHVDTFWELLDDIFNVVLFLLLGLELLVLPLEGQYLLAGVIAIPVVLLARLGSVWGTVKGISLVRPMERGTVTVLTWGGLRGGLAVALALSLPRTLRAERNLLLVATYVVVVFSILVQGLTIERLLGRLGMRAEKAAENLVASASS